MDTIDKLVVFAMVVFVWRRQMERQRSSKIENRRSALWSTRKSIRAAVFLTMLIFQRSLRLRNDLYCVEWGVKLYSLTHFQRSREAPRKVVLKRCSDIVSYEFFRMRRTCDYISLDVYYCELFSSRVRIRFSISVVSECAHVLILFSIVVVGY